MAITKEQIIEAAETLQAAGTNPTMTAIRDVLGGGSFATISPVLRHWRESKGQRATVAIEMPGEAKAALERAGVDLWRIVTTLATEKLTKVQEEAEAAITSANADRDEVLKEVELLEGEIERKDVELAGVLEAHEATTNTLNSTQDEVRALELKLAEKAGVRAENERLQAELAALRSENKVLIDEKFSLVGHVKDLENTLSRTEKELDRVSNLFQEKDALVSKLQTESVDLVSRVKELENGLLSAQKELAKALEQIDEKDSLSAKLQAENNTFNLQTQKLHLALDASESKSSELKNEVSELRKTVRDREREAGSLSGELKAVTVENKGLKAELEKIRSKIG
jgi:DNA repair exonuclease SbcCD ATPase subunit